MTSKDTTSNQQTPSLVASHANYAVGAAKVRDAELFQLAEVTANFSRKPSEGLRVVRTGKPVDSMIKMLQ